MLKNKFRHFGPRNICFADDGSGGEAAGGGGAPSKVSTNAGEGGSAAATVSTTAGEAAKVSQEGSSAAASVSSVVGSTPAEASGDFRTGWDDTLKNDAYLQGFKDTASLAKALLDNKKLVGQKLGIPGPDATPEQKAAFHEAMGVPKEAAGYGFKAPEGLPEGVEYNEKDAEDWANFFKENGIPAQAANAIRDRFMNKVIEDAKAMKGEADKDIQKSDENFERISLSVFGDKVKANAALQTARADMEKYGNPELKAALGQAPDSVLALFAQVYNAKVAELNGKENRDIDDNGGSGGSGETKEQLRAEARRLQALPEYSSPFTAKGKEEHERIVKEVKGLYDRVAKMA